jgi:hypothetical protein
LVGSENKHLALAALASPGSLVVEMQKSEYVSRATLLVAAMGMDTACSSRRTGAFNFDVVRSSFEFHPDF